MSQNNLNKSKTITPRKSNNEKKNQVKPEESKHFYNFLRPIVNDYSKLCKKEKKTDKLTQKNKEPSAKIMFEKPKITNINNFIMTNIDKKFRCQLCENLFKSPVECYKCLNLFCNECLMKKLDEFKKCPVCFNIVFREMMRNVDMEQMESYKQAKVKCPYIGCKENLRLKEIEPHLTSCIFQDMTELKKKHLNKIIFNNDADDPLMKTHMVNFLKEVNKSLSKLNPKEDKSCTLEDLGFVSKLSKFQEQLTSLNDYAAKTMAEMTKTTKLTNSNLKSLINN